ncbi:RNA-directed DNA polymerase, eukaryota, reverse transcriptase zinc-binding domain protein [Tanacetum coccineum]
MIDKRLIMDEYVKKNLQPFVSETKNCTHDMIKYFKYSWGAMERRENENSDEQDVCENAESAVQSVIADEVSGKGRETWSNLQMNKSFVGKHPWVLMGDFNVTLKPEEHSNGGSGINCDMQEFYDTINGLEVDDLCSSGFQFTWTKSLKNPENSTLKKLDKMMVNEEFILQYSKANEIFLPFLVSDHSAALMIFPKVARPVRTLDQLGDIVQVKLSKEDAKAMIVEMTDKEIKEAMFDIDFAKAFFKEAMFDMDFAKASGHDGYTSCFFKKSSEVIGKDVCMSIREFFTKGKLLREVNSTLIALVPKELKLTYLCFADDLLVLCNGDADSLRVVKKSLEEFSNVSGLFLNHSKSTIFFRSIMENQKQELLEIMPFKCGKFPMKYLGVPLLAKRLGVSDCIDLIDSVARRINSWRNKMLSYAGRIQLIASVLSYMQNYWAFVYMLPVIVVKELDKLFKRFLWSLGDSAKGKAKVAWNIIVDRKESRWVKWVNTVKLKSTSIWEIEGSNNDSWGWRNMLLVREKVKPFVSYKVRNGKDISVWHDKWCQLGPLDRLFSKSDLYDARLDDDAKIADMIHNGRWKWPEEWIEDHPDLLLIPVYCLNEHIKDKAYWVDEEDVENKLKSLSVRDSVVIDVANGFDLV